MSYGCHWRLAGVRYWWAWPVPAGGVVRAFAVSARCRSRAMRCRENRDELAAAEPDKPAGCQAGKWATWQNVPRQRSRRHRYPCARGSRSPSNRYRGGAAGSDADRAPPCAGQRASRRTPLAPEQKSAATVALKTVMHLRAHRGAKCASTPPAQAAKLMDVVTIVGS